MKTLTVTSGRARLGYWLQQAVEGKDIGIIVGDQVVALRPTKVTSDDYALQEYGLTAEEAARFERRVKREVARARRRGETQAFTGSLHRQRR
jgi:hypothetical protein